MRTGCWTPCPEMLTLQVWGAPLRFAFLTNSKVMSMLLLQGPHLENLRQVVMLSCLIDSLAPSPRGDF